MVISQSQEEKPPSLFHRLNPAVGTIKERYHLTGADSTKQTVHIVLDLGGVEIPFKPGDSIGIYPQNDPKAVGEMIQLMGGSEEQLITDPRTKQEISLWDFLSYKVNLLRTTSSFLNLFPQVEGDTKELYPLDVLRAYRGAVAPIQEICNQFSPMLPRFYSIASSPSLFPNEIHLTVALFTVEHRGEKRYGVGSHFLCHLAELGKTPVPFYVQPAHAFALPEDETAMIMVGPGTGIAPYRAFLQERVHRGAAGKNWLFFGERNRQSDYFYREYWEELVELKKLHLDLAFSRDQAEKIYVQHRMLERGKQIWEWLVEGAHFYVCGDAHRMAKDVESALVQIFQEHGSMSDEDAKAHLKAMRKQKRYWTDVY